MGNDLGAGGQQVVDQRKGGGLADVVSAGLEGYPPDGEAAARERAGAEAGADLLDQALLLEAVDLVDGLDEVGADAAVAGGCARAWTSLGKHEPP